MNSSYRRFSNLSSLAILVFSLLFSLISGCAEVRPVTVNTPSEGRLRERVQDFHVILGNNDIATWYAMTTPTTRKKMTFDKFKQDLRWDDKKAARTKEPMQAELSRVCNCVDVGTIRCVIIADVRISKPDGKTVQDRPLEMWEFADGEWYWGYIGAGSRGKCPGEK